VELGPVLHGCDNKYRMEQARLYREAGVGVSFFHLHHPSFKPQPVDINLFRYAKKHKIPVQLIPLRFKGRKIAQKLTEKIIGKQDFPIWDALRNDEEGQESMFNGNIPTWANSYEERGVGELTPIIEKMHPTWMEMVGENRGLTRMCAHDNKTTICGGCFSKRGLIEPTIPMELNPNNKLKSRNRERNRSKRRRMKQIAQMGQESIQF